MHHLRDQPELLFQDQAAHIGMGKAGALAHGFRAACDRIAQGKRQQAFDQSGAAAAAGRSLALAAYRIKAASPCADRFDYLALGYAVTAADFGIIRKRCNGGIRVRKGTSRSKGLAEDKRFADRGYVLAFFSRSKYQLPSAVSP